MIDHKAEADTIVMGGEFESTTALTRAQVHATLYLAEQQRTANLLAALGSHGWEVDEGWFTVTDKQVIERVKQRNEIRAQIREGLGH